LAPALVGLALPFGIQSWGVVYVVAENSIAIFAVPARVKDMLMPELIHLLRRWRKNLSFAPVGQRIEEPLVVALYPRRLVLAPVELFYGLGAHRSQLQLLNVPLGK